MTDWPVKTLGDLMTVQNGYAFDSQYFSLSGKIGLIRIRDLKSGVGTETHFVGPYDDEYVVTSGDYLIGMDGEFRCYEWKGDPALLNQRVCRLREFGNSLDARFLFYGINRFLKEIEDITGYTTVKHLSSKSILAIEMPVPPLAEQKRIVALLDAATERVTKLTACYEQARTHANNLFTSALRNALEGNPDWPIKTLGDMLTLSYGKPLEPKDRDDNGAIPVYGANGVKAWSKRSLVSGPSIVVGRKGSAGELNFCDEPFWPLDVTYFVEHDVKVTDLTFLHYLLSLMDLPSLAKGVKPGINRNDVYVLQSPVPPLVEQKRIVMRLDAMRAKTSEMVAAYDAKLQAAKDLRQSVLEAAVAGEL